jgi:hypothetical protein
MQRLLRGLRGDDEMSSKEKHQTTGPGVGGSDQWAETKVIPASNMRFSSTKLTDFPQRTICCLLIPGSLHSLRIKTFRVVNPNLV